MIHIYISLWTNYNATEIDLNDIKTTFTFHYELIITVIACPNDRRKSYLHFTMN